MGMGRVRWTSIAVAALALGLNNTINVRSGRAEYRREAPPPGEATEEQKAIRGPKTGKRTKKWRRKHSQ